MGTLQSQHEAVALCSRSSCNPCYTHSTGKQQGNGLTRACHVMVTRLGKAQGMGPTGACHVMGARLGYHSGEKGLTQA